MTAPREGEPLAILVADDEEPIVSVVGVVLEDLGYRTLSAANGRQALDLARTAWPALVITDLMMPQMTGAELIAALRAEAAALGRPPIPVILMTAAGSQHAREAGADVLLGKPFDLEELEQAIARVLDDARGGAGS